jgi:hypothetical protein
MKHNKMIVQKGANHGIGTFETTHAKVYYLSNSTYFSIRRFIFQSFENSVRISRVCKPVIPGLTELRCAVFLLVLPVDVDGQKLARETRIPFGLMVCSLYYLKPAVM